VVLHRGNLKAEDVSSLAWRPGSSCPIVARIVELHKSWDEIDIPREGIVTVAGRDYTVWDGPKEKLKPIVGRSDELDVPFTMWEIGPFAAGSHQVVRLRLSMARGTYNNQIGGREFYAYGDAILLDRIREDLQTYSETDLDSYEVALASIQTRILPSIFEYLLITLPGTTARWKTTSFTYNFSPQPLPDKYRDNVHWFVARYPEVGTFTLEGEPECAFSLKVQEAQPA
jgi:hypothetical protein